MQSVDPTGTPTGCRYPDCQNQGVKGKSSARARRKTTGLLRMRSTPGCHRRWWTTGPRTWQSSTHRPKRSLQEGSPTCFTSSARAPRTRRASPLSSSWSSSSSSASLPRSPCPRSSTSARRLRTPRPRRRPHRSDRPRDLLHRRAGPTSGDRRRDAQGDRAALAERHGAAPTVWPEDRPAATGYTITVTSKGKNKVVYTIVNTDGVVSHLRCPSARAAASPTGKW